MISILVKVDAGGAESLQKRHEAASLQQRLDEEIAGRRRMQDEMRALEAKAQRSDAQLKRELEAAQGLAPPSASQELSAVAQETRINQLQS
eukprot:2634563-Prymnesium_polylepis.1